MIEVEEGRGSKLFKFINVLVNIPQFIPTVENYWKSIYPLFISTSTMLRLSKKFKVLKLILRSLGKEKKWDLPRRTRDAYDNLCEKQTAKLLKKWQGLADLEESFLKQKSKLHWLNVGGQNNTFSIRRHKQEK